MNKGPATSQQCAKRPGFVRLACGGGARGWLRCVPLLFLKYKNDKLQTEFNYKATAPRRRPAAATPPPRLPTAHHPRTAAAAVNRRPPSAVSLPSSSARACARATPTDTLTSAAVVVVAAATVVADAGARTRTWRCEWERGKWVARSKC